MACYQGGKQKIGKYIYNTIIELENKINHLNQNNEKLPYLEPFVGFCGVLKHFSNDKKSNRIIEAYDANPDIIDMWAALQDGWIPDGKCDKEKHLRLKKSEPSPERTLYGHVCSYGGIFFKSFLQSKDYAAMGTRSILKITQQVRNVKFIHSPYQQLQPKNSLIYCDPPYKNNQLGNKFFKSFDTDEFWEIMRRWTDDGNIIIISEFRAPNDFKCIWEMSRPTLAKKTHAKTKQRHVEKLFIHESIYNKYIINQ